MKEAMKKEKKARTKKKYLIVKSTLYKLLFLVLWKTKSSQQMCSARHQELANPGDVTAIQGRGEGKGANNSLCFLRGKEGGVSCCCLHVTYSNTRQL